MRRYRRSKTPEERRALYAKQDPEKRRAREHFRYLRRKGSPEVVANYTLNNAIRDRRLHRGPCEVCGTTAKVHGHHDDYSKPLDVRWLCEEHHLELHEQLRREVVIPQPEAGRMALPRGDER